MTNKYIGNKINWYYDDSKMIDMTEIEMSIKNINDKIKEYVKENKDEPERLKFTVDQMVKLNDLMEPCLQCNYQGITIKVVK